MDTLNYHHLRYFREVAHEGNLTRSAERMRLSQSALSAQIRTLEDRLGHTLFDRVGRSLKLTEVGRITLDYADRIFDTGHELLVTLERGYDSKAPLRVGALSTLSRNFQMRFLGPLIAQDVELVLKSGSEAELYAGLRSLALDVLLTTEPPQTDAGAEFTAHRIAEQKVGLYGVPERMRHKDLRALLSNEPMIVPTDTAVRRGFDALIAELNVRPRIIADVDDMAMVRLLARAGAGVAIAPDVVLADELAAGRLVGARTSLEITESFYAVTVKRSFPHPVLADILPM
ncbi:MAG: LysR family transcriptional regulator [Pseudomonadota bacterium]